MEKIIAMKETGYITLWDVESVFVVEDNDFSIKYAI